MDGVDRKEHGVDQMSSTADPIGVGDPQQQMLWDP